MTRKRDELCANCHTRQREGELLCNVCRVIADRRIAEMPVVMPDVLISGTGPWDLGALPKPPKRFPWLAAERDG